MPRWFLSYHSPDQNLAERLKGAIERKDSVSRVFFAPQHLRAGRSWSKQLADEIAEADAFILLIGEKGVGDWQELEYDEALDKWTTSRNRSPDFPLIVVLLEGQKAPGLQFLRRMHWIVTRDPASEIDVARIFEAAAGRGSNPGELWRHTSPYRGLEAMEEKDSDYFFGRKRETVEVLNALAAPDRLPILIGNSGVGKSSLAKAGVLAALKRQARPEQASGPNGWPAVFQESRQWCFLSLRPGTDPLKALVESFLDTWQYNATDPERVKQQLGWIELLRGKATLSDLIEATERRRKELDQPKPPAFFLYVDQGEELYMRAEEHQRRRFSELLAQALPERRCGHLRAGDRHHRWPYWGDLSNVHHGRMALRHRHTSLLVHARARSCVECGQGAGAQAWGSFKECAQDCPEMIVVPAGSFTMGGPNNVEQPQHTVTFAKPFAVSKYELTFADWDACVAGGGCNGYKPTDQGWGRGQQPVINVNLNDAQAYVAWLSEVTGKTYRLLTEAEYEYATRAGTTTAYPWGDDIKLNGQAMADCDGCGSKWDRRQTAPVGSFYPNEFGLYDMIGNVWEWTEDCIHHNYNGVPTDGSAWLAADGGDCTGGRILRGGSWINTPDDLRSANRNWFTTDLRFFDFGFRVGRTLLAP